MNNKLQPVRGTHDILPEEYGGDFEKFWDVTTVARQLAMLYGFREMVTPIFEQTEVFSRSMGETSDVVSKGMFTFETRGGDSVTLRPEFTAGIARAFISNGMQQHLPLKLFTTGPLFRYERPQKGRQRQFNQVNFEWLGDDSWQADAEMILLAGHLLSMLSEAEITLHINTLGDAQSREHYRDALVAYLTPFSDRLSEDSQRRLSSNLLRILDSKDKGDREILLGAPVMTDYLSEAAKERFEKIWDLLKDDMLQFSQKIVIDPALVRGLDYYTDTVFEFVAKTGELGAQDTVLAGGRYDGLIEQMGGRPTPAIGFAAGVERLALLSGGGDEYNVGQYKVMLLPSEDMPVNTVFSVSSVLRFNLSDALPFLQVEILWHGKLAKRLEKAAKNGASHVIIMSHDDEKQGQCVVKNMAARTEKKVFFDDFANEEQIGSIFDI